MMEFLDVSGERFEYEMNMLIHAKEKKIRIMEIPIQTIISRIINPLILIRLRIQSRYMLCFSSLCYLQFLPFAIDAILFVIFNAVFRNIIPITTS